MAITFTSKVSAGSTTDGQTFSTSNWTPSNNNGYLLSVANDESGAADARVPTVDGTNNGLTWVIVGSNGSSAYAGSARQQRVSVFRALVTSGASFGSTTFSFSTHTMNSIQWSVSELAGMDATGTNGSGFIVQAASSVGTASAPNTSMATFADVTNNAAYVACAEKGSTAMSASTGMTRIDEGGQTSNNIHLMTAFQVSQNTGPGSQTSVAFWGAVSVEVKAAAAATVLGTNYYYRRRRAEA